MKVVWSPVAIQRVIDAGRYISERNPEAGDRWVRRIFLRVEKLAAFPRSGRVVAERGREDTREVIFEKYRVIYRVQEARLLVLTVRHATRPLDPSEIE